MFPESKVGKKHCMVRVIIGFHTLSYLFKTRELIYESRDGYFSIKNCFCQVSKHKS